MKRTTATLRIDPEQLKALKHISKIAGLTVNQLLRNAIGNYLNRPDPSSFGGTVSALRAYRKQDPAFKKAIGKFVEAEVNLSDPLEDGVIREQLGPVQRKIRDILDS